MVYNNNNMVYKIIINMVYNNNMVYKNNNKYGLQ